MNDCVSGLFKTDRYSVCIRQLYEFLLCLFYDVGVDRIPPYVRKRRVIFHAMTAYGEVALSSTTGGGSNRYHFSGGRLVANQAKQIKSHHSV